LHEHFRDRVVALAHEVGGLAHDLGAVVGRGRAPQREAFLRGFQCFVEIGLAGVGQVRERLLGRRIEHVLALAAAAGHPLAGDVDGGCGREGPLCWSRNGGDIWWRRISIFGGWIPPSPRLCSHSKRSEMPALAGAIAKDGTPPKNVPPLTWMFCPVMKLAPGPQRKRTAAATSAGSPRRPTSTCTSA